MGKHYTIGGVATVTGHADGMGQSPLPPMPATVTMDPAGIDLFHTMLQIVYAHKYSPYRVPATAAEAEVRENRKAAIAYLHAEGIFDRTGAMRARIDVTYIDQWIAEYTLQHRNRTLPIRVRIDPRRGLEDCLSVQAPAGPFVTIDFRLLHVSMPPPSG